MHFYSATRTMENWNLIRTAYQVARLGTVNAAAKFLDVNRTTVIRHIDSLEVFLGEKLFYRYSGKYQATPVGLELMRVAKTTEEQFAQFVGLTKSRTQELSGEFILTSLDIVAPILMPIINDFQNQHPQILVRYLVDKKLFRLEYGEAHIAIRAGSFLDRPDNLVELFTKLKMGLYASHDYVTYHGKPQKLHDFTKHRFIGPEHLPAVAPFHIWMLNNIEDNKVIFRSTSYLAQEQAVLSGIGIGFFPAHKANLYSNLIEIWPHQEEWDVPFWLITHTDLHFSAKVQAFLKLLKKAKKEF